MREEMKSTKNEYYFLAFVWAVALSAICFTYVETAKKEEGPKIIEYKSGDVDFIQDDPFLRVD